MPAEKFRRYRPAYKEIKWVKRKPSTEKVLGLAAAPKSTLAAAVEEMGEPTVEGTPLEEALHLLSAAAEIEHQLMVAYLYARYSLTTAAPSMWADALKRVAVEEMGHLLTVENLLLLIGGKPHFARVSPEMMGKAPFPFRVEPLSTRSLAKYVTAESPAPETLPQDVLQRAKLAFQEASEQSVAIHGRVGVLYAKLIWLFKDPATPAKEVGIPAGIFTAGRHLKDEDFQSGSVALQARPRDWGMRENPEQGRFAMLCPDRATALDALRKIAEQGEGLTPADLAVDSHFERFLAVYDDAVALRSAGNPLPVRPVGTDPTYGTEVLPDQGEELARIDHPEAQAWARLADIHYTILLGVIAVSFEIPSGGANDSIRRQLSSHAIVGQMRPLADLAGLLSELPRKAGGDPATAAASIPFSDPHRPNGDDLEDWKSFLTEQATASGVLIGEIRAANANGLLDTFEESNAELIALIASLPSEGSDT